jgi:uncharacterized circularly permuted ATP-grasp superfamily protein
VSGDNLVVTAADLGVQIWDEAFTAGGEVRPHYAGVVARLEGTDLDAGVREVRGECAARGCLFDADPFRVDLVPRVLTAAEWDALACGLEQRVRALDAFIADVYAERRCVAEGVVPARVVEGAEHHEPQLAALPAPPLRVALAGLDVIRTPEGEFQVLEDNLRTPSGLAYAFAARAAVQPRLAGPGVPEPVPFQPAAVAALGRALRAAAPAVEGEPRVVLLSDGDGNTAYWEHAMLAEQLGVPVVTLDELDLDAVDVVYRRTTDDRLTEGGATTAVGAALLPALRTGRVACVNALGNGVADDKLVHAYVEDMVRFYLGEEPRVRSVPTFDPARAECREELLDRLDEVVVKPRDGYGGWGVFVGPLAAPRERDAVAAALLDRPDAYIAQETVFFSTHPTVVDGGLEPRHVDLRAFVTFDGERAEALPGGLTRVAYRAGELVVNSSQGGGGKDTWVLP